MELRINIFGVWKLASTLVLGSLLPSKIIKVKSIQTGVTNWGRTKLSLSDIAKRANQEDRCTGRFWQGRFKSIKLLDKSAILACLAYIDLNPIHAGIAETIQNSDFTSAQDRLVSRITKDKLNA